MVMTTTKKQQAERADWPVQDMWCLMTVWSNPLTNRYGPGVYQRIIRFLSRNGHVLTYDYRAARLYGEPPLQDLRDVSVHTFAEYRCLSDECQHFGRVGPALMHWTWVLNNR